MLIISRRKNETFLVNDNIEITILEVSKDKIRIGIEAPKNVKILRKELAETEKANVEAMRTAENIDFKKLITLKF